MEEATGRGFTQRGAGAYPLSEVETRSLVVFLLEHPNISVMNTMDTTVPMHLRPPSTSPSEERMYPEDLALYEYFDEKGIRNAYLTGSRNQTQRKEAVNDFQNKENCPVFLISLKAGGVGLNLTAADYVFILDPWWNPAAEMQALNRAHRIGQDKNVFVYRFISGNSIEEKIQRLQERKLELAGNMVSSNNPLKGLSEKEVIDLFK
jgi:hypothetical protein